MRTPRAAARATTPPSLWTHVLPLLTGVVAVLVAAAVVMLVAPDSVNDDAIATLAASGLGILGTHVGHVTGHRMAREAAERNGHLTPE